MKDFIDKEISFFKYFRKNKVSLAYTSRDFYLIDHSGGQYRSFHFNFDNPEKRFRPIFSYAYEEKNRLESVSRIWITYKCQQEIDIFEIKNVDFEFSGSRSKMLIKKNSNGK